MNGSATVFAWVEDEGHVPDVTVEIIPLMSLSWSFPDVIVAIGDIGKRS